MGGKRHPPAKTLQGLKIQRAAMLRDIKNKSDGMGLWKMIVRLERINLAIDELIKEAMGEPKGASPAYWKRLKEESKRIGWRGEYSVVSWLRKRGWFAKRSYGSWGADVFAAKSDFQLGDFPERPTFSKHYKVLLIDVKSSDSWTAEALQAKPIDEDVVKESRRTGIPVVRAACVKGKSPVFFWESGERIDPKWFN